MKRIGIFGGSFNPVHHGHLLLARAAFEALRLDEMLFVPCHDSADGKKLLPAAKRLAMLKAALRGVKNFSVSEVDLKRGGVSRSVDTVRELGAAAGKGAKFFLLIGADQASQFPRWKDAELLAMQAQICVLARPGHSSSISIHKKYRFKTLNVPQYEISSSEIRTRLKKNLPLNWFLPSSALSILKRCRHIV